MIPAVSRSLPFLIEVYFVVFSALGVVFCIFCSCVICFCHCVWHFPATEHLAELLFILLSYAGLKKVLWRLYAKFLLNIYIYGAEPALFKSMFRC